MADSQTAVSPGISARVAELAAQLSVDECADLMTGLGIWTGRPVERLGIPSLVVTDGPNGARGGGLMGTGTATACIPAGSVSERSMFAWLLPAAVFVTVKRIVLVAPTSMDAGEKDLARFIRAPTVSVSLPPVVAAGVWSDRMFVTVLL